jgi:hypothetical protein
VYRRGAEPSGESLLPGAARAGRPSAKGRSRPIVIVAKVDPSVPQDIRRKHSDGREDKYIFVRHAEETEGIVIMGPDEHN